MALAPNINNGNHGGGSCNTLMNLGLDLEDGLLPEDAVKFVKEQHDEALQLVDNDIGPYWVCGMHVVAAIMGQRDLVGDKDWTMAFV